MPTPESIPLFIHGQPFKSASCDTVNVINPATQEVLGHVPLATPEEIDLAVSSALHAFQKWKNTPILQRSRLMLSYQALLKQHQKEIAAILSKETGKVFEDAMGDVWRGIEVVEQAANIAADLTGHSLTQVASGIDTVSYRYPLGVCVGITPFNFPAMIPLWMFPLAIACGNTFVLKPSEQDPMTSVRLAELFYQAGAPENSLQIIHGARDQAEALIHHPDTCAVSFVGSVGAARSVYRTATENLKRAQCFGGAKNHMVIMPDANKDQVINNLVGASVGAAGQRCMAISVAVFVGDAEKWQDDLKTAMEKIRPGLWQDKAADYGPLISSEAKERVLKLIQQGKDEGATCLLDGSSCRVEGAPEGNWIGPTLFTRVTPEMSIYREEIFGPVLCCIHVDSLNDAISLVNKHPCGNGTSIFTANGGDAARYRHEIEVGMVGINIPIPVPVPVFSFTGWKDSFYGDAHAYGKEMINFYTKSKTVTTRWFEDNSMTQGPNMTIKLK